jgi:iron complex outermembrane receptor protein
MAPGIQFQIPPTATTLAGISFVDASDSAMWGAELSAQGRLGGGFHWSADTTYTNVTDQPFTGRDLAALNAAYAQTTPKYRGNVALGWSDAHWTVDGYLHLVSNFDSYTNPTGFGSVLERVPAYATLASRIGYQTSSGVVLAVSGQNLLIDHQVQAQTSGLRAERRILFSVSKGW